MSEYKRIWVQIYKPILCSSIVLIQTYFVGAGMDPSNYERRDL